LERRNKKNSYINVGRDDLFLYIFFVREINVTEERD